MVFKIEINRGADLVMEGNASLKTNGDRLYGSIEDLHFAHIAEQDTLITDEEVYGRIEDAIAGMNLFYNSKGWDTYLTVGQISEVITVVFECLNIDEEIKALAKKANKRASTLELSTFSDVLKNWREIINGGVLEAFNLNRINLEKILIQGEVKNLTHLEKIELLVDSGINEELFKLLQPDVDKETDTLVFTAKDAFKCAGIYSTNVHAGMLNYRIPARTLRQFMWAVDKIRDNDKHLIFGRQIFNAYSREELGLSSK